MRTSPASRVEAPWWTYMADRVDELQEWTLAWSPAVLWHWLCRHKVAALAGLIFLLSISVGAARAYADPGTGAGNGGDPIIAWMGIKDTHGVPVAKYTLTMNRGGWDPSEKPFAWLTSMYYEAYLIFAASALWLIKFVLSFEWMSVFTEPFKAIGEGITTAMDRFGLLPTAIAIFSIVFAFTILSGKVAKAYSNAAMGLVMIALAGTIFANVLGDLIGPDGLLAKGRDTGLEIASTVSGGSMTKNGSKANVDDLTASLADRFLRAPTQMINFGMVSDSVSRKCEEAWTNGIKGNGDKDKLKDDIKLCDKDKGTAMHKESMKPASAMLTAVGFCTALSGVLIAFACYFTWHVIRSAVHAMMFAALAPPAFVAGVIPGGPQTFAWKTVLDCFMAYLAMIVFTAGFGGYNAVLDTVFKKYSSNAYQAIFLTTIVLAFGFAFFGPIRKMFDQSRDSLASKLGSGNGASTAGQGWLSKAADMSRIKQELNSWRGKGSSSGAGGEREPGRVDTAEPMKEEAETLTAPAAQEVSFLSGAEASAAHERLAEAHQMTGGSQSESVMSGSRQSPVSLVEWSGQTNTGGGSTDPLARAIRLSRTAAGGERSTLYVPPGTRHSLSEAA